MPETKTRTTVVIGGREVSLLIGALIAQEADRLELPPGRVGDVVVPDPAPERFEIAGCSLSVETAALLAEDADARGILVHELVAQIAHEYADGLERGRGGRKN